MKSAEDRPFSDPTEPLDWPIGWRILVQRQVSSKFVVIAGVGGKYPAQMDFVEDDSMIEAFAADRAEQPLHMAVLPR